MAIEAAMSENTQDISAENISDSSAEEPTRLRERSTIRFPYNDLNDAITVARTLHDQRGGQCSSDELAAELGHTVTSGRFRIRLAGTQLYGLISLSRQRVVLTRLGGRIIDPRTEAEARVEAFLSVPLYKEVYQGCQGKPLPGPAGLEAMMRDLGVATNQATRVRQVFARAADQAGFFTTGRDRLVKPPVGGMVEDRVEKPDLDVPDQPPEEGVPLSDPILHGLLTRMLPPEGEKFSAHDRRRFLYALAVNLYVIYGEPDDGSLDPAQVAALIKLNSENVTPAPSRVAPNGASPVPEAAPSAADSYSADA
jgi:hypothetical protein